MTQTKDNRHQHNIDGVGDDNDNDNNNDNSTNTYCHQISKNAYLVQAELVDFWRCCIDHGWTTTKSILSDNDCRSLSNYADGDGDKNIQNGDDVDDDDERFHNNNNNNNINNKNNNTRRCLQITHHYILYPNPYPTNVRLSKRWYAHPSFPLLLKLQADTIILRSNWNVYLQEFASAIELAHDYYSNFNSNDLTNNAITTTTTTTINASTPNVIITKNDNTMSSSRCSTTTTSITNFARPYLSSAKAGPNERMIDKSSTSLTNFERKYDNVGETTYELILQKKDRSP